jgi:hypothetical protein
MKRLAALLLAALAAGCVSKQDANSGAIRVLNAVPDGPPINAYINGALQVVGLGYAVATPYTAPAAGTYQIRLDAQLPVNADPDFQTVYDQSSTIAVADELTLVLLGSAAGGTEQVVQVLTTTRGVPTGKTRVQFMHASVGGNPVDVYVTAPDAPIPGSTPFATSLGYTAVTPQQDLAGGDAQIVITEAGNPSAVLLATNTVFLPLQGTLLIAIVQNPGVDSATHPYVLSILTGIGSGIVVDEGTQANVRLVDASPGSYSLDLFLNSTSVDDTSRQVCDAGTTEEGTALEICAAPFGSVSAYNAIAAGGYDVKLQVTANDALPAQTFAGSFAAGSSSTLVPIQLIADTATTMNLNLLNVPAGRRIATAAQLRVIDASVAADAAVAADPSTDRLELYIAPADADLAAEDPDFFGFGLGFDTGLISLLPGIYRVTLAITDTSSASAVPQVLFTQLVSLATSGLYTLVVVDSVGGVQPLQSLSIEDDPTPQP